VEGIVPRRTGPVVLVVLVALVLMIAAACTSGTAGRSGAPTSTTAAAHHPATTAAPAAARGQARVQFEQLLGQHALIAVRLMRSVVAAEPDFRQAAAASLQANTDALSQLVAAAYGAVEGDRFTQVWQRHQGDLSNYAEAVASKDASAEKTALAALVAGCDAYGAWVAEATKGRVRAGDATRTMRQHAEDLSGQADAYAARDYGDAYRIEREAFEHMFMTGTTLAKASLEPKAAARLDTPPEQLRSAFAMLLGEHMELIIGAQRATFAKPEEFQAAAAQINANTTAITTAMGAIVGPKKAAEFQAGWAQHVEALIAYGAAAARGDQAGKAAAEKQLDTLALGLAQYLSGIVHNRLRVGLLTGAITEHDRHLLGHVDAYAARDYTKAYAMEADGYRQMRGVADTLVDAIQRTVKPGLPVGGSQTGGGGTAHRHR
jgi:hypothetical protein